jgi:hypothetical protein
LNWPAAYCLGPGRVLAGERETYGALPGRRGDECAGNTGRTKNAFHNTPRAAEGKSPNRSFAGTCPNEFNERMIRAALENDCGEQRRIDRSAALWTIRQNWHVFYTDEPAVFIEQGDCARSAYIDPEEEAH